MEPVAFLIDFLLHLDQHLALAIQTYGLWTYVILFAIIFLETGLVVMPFLPGDSLLFAAGALAAIGSLDVVWLFALLSIAAILGDTVNYWLGHYFGPKIFRKENVRFLKKEYLERSHKFYEKYGGKTIVIARFIPIIRTFAPFVAGIGKMNYWRFLGYNVFGGILWVGSFTFAGYFLGNLPIIRENFALFIIGIIVATLLLAAAEFLRHRKHG